MCTIISLMNHYLTDVNHYLTDVVLTITFLIVVFNLFVRKIRLILNVEVKIGSICSVKTGFSLYSKSKYSDFRF
jgi:hypothetical protein